MLPLQKRLRISAVGLLHAHQITSLRVALAPGIKCSRRAFDFNLSEIEQLEHLSRRAWIRLRARNYERIGRGPCDGTASHFIEIPEKIAAPCGRLV